VSITLIAGQALLNDSWRHLESFVALLSRMPLAANSSRLLNDACSQHLFSVVSSLVPHGTKSIRLRHRLELRLRNGEPTMNSRSVCLAIILTLLSSAGRAQAGNIDKPVTITYVNSPYADFLFYLFYRNAGPFSALKSAVPLDDVSQLQDDSFLPDETAASAIASYAELYKLVSTYDAHAPLTVELQKGEPHYQAFFSFWKMQIGPKEEQTIAAWKKQEADWPPVVHLEQLERLKFPFSSVKVAMLSLDPQGSSMQGPPTIFTTTQVPSLAWAIGHEGTHMMLGPKGADWKNRKDAQQAIRLITANGGGEYDVEEALCLLMQAKLSIASGATPKGYLVSQDYTRVSPRRTLLLTLERDWPSYQAASDINIADFLIAETIKTFGPSRSEPASDAQQ
jgi:hypothetical protein